MLSATRVVSPNIFHFLFEWINLVLEVFMLRTAQFFNDYYSTYYGYSTTTVGPFPVTLSLPFWQYEPENCMHYLLPLPHGLGARNCSDLSRKENKQKQTEEQFPKLYCLNIWFFYCSTICAQNQEVILNKINNIAFLKLFFIQCVDTTVQLQHQRNENR